jgi:hypothetical protein
MAMAIANFFWPCRDCSVGPHYFCIICKNLTHVCYIKLFLIQGSEVAVDNLSYRDTMYEFILVIHMLHSLDGRAGLFAADGSVGPCPEELLLPKLPDRFAVNR